MLYGTQHEPAPRQHNPRLPVWRQRSSQQRQFPARTTAPTRVLTVTPQSSYVKSVTRTYIMPNEFVPGPV